MPSPTQKAISTLTFSHLHLYRKLPFRIAYRFWTVEALLARRKLEGSPFRSAWVPRATTRSARCLGFLATARSPSS